MCLCTFCTRVRPRYTTDPAGHLEIVASSEADLGRYRFGLGLADFLFCRRCSVFVGAHQPGDAPIAVINIGALDARERFTGEAASFDFDAEDEAARLARRRRGWTPATLVVG